MPSSIHRFLAIGPLFLCVLLATGTTHAQATTESLYKTKCAACHAADGSGDTAIGKKLGAHDFRSPEVQKLTDAQLTEIVTKGKEKMPGYDKKLTPEQIKQLVGYVRELSKKK